MKTLDYRDRLRTELSRRCERSPNYSLRAFARDLKLDPGHLSRVLTGKQNLSEASAREVADLLFESLSEKDLFVSLVTYSTAKKDSAKVRALKRVNDLNPTEEVNLSFDAIRVISDWYHIAILDLSDVYGFKMTYPKISAALGITQLEAKLATERLLKLGLLKWSEKKLVKTNVKLASPTNIPNEDLKKFHRQMISKGLQSLTEQKTEDRYIVSKTMSIDKRLLGKLRDITDRYFAEVSDLIKTKPVKNSLYQLNVQIFNLLKNERKKK